MIHNIRGRKKRDEELENLRKQIERYAEEEKLRRVLYLACGLSGLTYASMYRGGADFINVDYLDCGIENGVHFLDNDRLRKIIHDLYSHKRKGQMIYITATALCHLANQYGQNFIALPFAIGDFGFTNLYQTFRKGLVSVLVGFSGTLYILGGPYTQVIGFILGIVGLRLGFTNLDVIATSPIFGTDSLKNLKPRIPDVKDVVVVNNRNRDKIVMTNLRPEKIECWMPDQALLNPNCQVKSNAIDIISNDLDLTYSEVVNMQDRTLLDRVEFSDIYDLEPAKTSISKPRTGKMVNFLEKFGDPKNIDEIETWNTSEPSILEKISLRIRNKL